MQTGKRNRRDGVLLMRPEENRPLGRSPCRWKDIINMDLQEVGWGGMG
jgi:hypothetical protein